MFFKLKYNKIKNWVYNVWPFYRKPDWHKVIVKYLLSGAVATATHLLVLSLAYRFLGWTIIYATTLAFAVAFIISFSLQKFWTFKNRAKRYFEQIYLYFLVGIFNLFLNAALMQVLAVNLNLHYLLSQLFVSAVVAVNSFLLYKYLVFKYKK